LPPLAHLQLGVGEAVLAQVKIAADVATVGGPGIGPGAGRCCGYRYCRYRCYRLGGGVGHLCDDRGLGGGQTGDGCGEDRGCHRGQELLVAMAHVAVPQLIVVGLQQRVPVLGCEDSARAALGARGAHKEVAGLRAWGGG
jgi:hypothetical protein